MTLQPNTALDHFRIVARTLASSGPGAGHGKPAPSASSLPGTPLPAGRRLGRSRLVAGAAGTVLALAAVALVVALRDSGPSGGGGGGGGGGVGSPPVQSDGGANSGPFGDPDRGDRTAADEQAEAERRAEAQRLAEARNRPGAVFRDCAACPEMVVVPSGGFMMGSPESEEDRDDREGPRRRVTIARPFAMGVYEVTFDEWEACADDGGCSHSPRDWGWGRGTRPVIHVSWEDAREYVAWLSRETGEAYRLPSEAEWEYAARAGTETRYSWGDGIGSNRANCDGCGSRWDDERTAPVGSFPPNAWGLRDMHGNVYEWTEDCWNDYYRGAPSDGSAWLSGDCRVRVLRGGSWLSLPRHLRSAYRNGDLAGNRYFGVRVVRTMN